MEAVVGQVVDEPEAAPRPVQAAAKAEPRQVHQWIQQPVRAEPMYSWLVWHWKVPSYQEWAYLTGSNTVA